MVFKAKDRGFASATDTLIGAGTEMEGQMRSLGGIRVEGTFSGEIESKGDVVVGEKGIARSSITARDVTIAGKVYGDVRTMGCLTITATGQLHGNLHAAALVIQEGGQLNGMSQMVKPDAKPGEMSGAAAGQEQAQSRKAKQAG